MKRTTINITSLLALLFAAIAPASVSFAQDKTTDVTAKTEQAAPATPRRTRRVNNRATKKTAPETGQPVESKQEEPKTDNTAKAEEPAQDQTEATAKQKEDDPVEVAAKPDEPKAPNEKDQPATTSAKVNNTDPVADLRDQIEAAGTPIEKSRLRMQLVGLFIGKGKNQDAINELRAITFEDHFDPQGLYNAGNALARLGDTEGAVAAYQKAIEQRKGRYSRALNNLGVVLLRQGRWDEAHEALMSALRLESFRYAEASYNLGRLYASRGETDLAVREWRRALAVNPEHKAAAQALSSAGVQGQISIASAVKPPAYRDKPPAYDKTPASVSKPARRPAESLTVRPTKATVAPATNKALTVDPETYSYLQRARTARDRDRQEEAVTNYKRVLSRMNGYFAPANLELSYSLISLKRLDEAIDVLAPVTERDGQRYPISYYHLARLYEGRGDLRLAEENFNRAATYYRKDNAQFLLDVSRVREKLGDLQGALNVLEEYLATIEAKNLKPDWSTERLTSLKQRIAAAQPKP